MNWSEIETFECASIKANLSVLSNNYIAKVYSKKGQIKVVAALIIQLRPGWFSIGYENTDGQRLVAPGVHQIPCIAHADNLEYILVEPL